MAMAATLAATSYSPPGRAAVLSTRLGNTRRAVEALMQLMAALERGKLWWKWHSTACVPCEVRVRDGSETTRAACNLPPLHDSRC